MTDARVTAATVDRVREAGWGGQKCGRMGGLGVHPWMAARPASAGFSLVPRARLTRPPRRRLVGWVRVVGLGIFSVQVLAGAGSQSLVMQAQAVMSWWIGEGRNLEWER
jgi:hypothetical protein